MLLELSYITALISEYKKYSHGVCRTGGGSTEEHLDLLADM